MIVYKATRSSPLQLLAKDPEASLDYVMDWAMEGTPWLSEGESLINSTWDIVGNGTILYHTFDATKAVVWIAGGSEGTILTLTNHIVTNMGRKDDRSIRIPIRNK